MKKLLALIVLALTAAGFSAPAGAHANGTSYLIIESSADGPVSLRWDVGLVDLVWTVFIDRDIDGVATWEEIKAAEPDIARATLAELLVKRGGVACQVEFRDLALAKRVEQNFLSINFSARCPQAGLLEVGGSLLMAGDTTQRVLVNLTRGSEDVTGVVGFTTPVWHEPAQISVFESFLRFIGEGIWHVLIGYDHIAFVLLLLLPAVLRQENGRWQGAQRLRDVARELFTIVTAFTIAHSITLGLAATGTVRLPIRPIEIAIAASIAVAGLINLAPQLARLRLPLAFGFGLVHGFGFANALSEIDAAGVKLLPLLGGFNIGVEIAQLGIVALVLPAIYVARGTRWYASALMPLGSCLLAGAGFVWLFQRVMAE